MTHVDDEWFADEAFWITMYPFMFPDSRIAAADGEVEQILALAQCAGGTAKETRARIFSPTTSRDIPNGLLIMRHKIVDDWSRIENEWILIEGESVRTFRFRHWIYSGREIARMFRDAGFADVRLCGDYLGTPYGREAGRLVVVGRKA